MICTVLAQCQCIAEIYLTNGSYSLVLVESLHDSSIKWSVAGRTLYWMKLEKLHREAGSGGDSRGGIEGST